MHQISRNIFRKYIYIYIYIYNKNKEDVQSILASATTGQRQRFSFSYKMHPVTFLATLNLYVVLGNLTDLCLAWTWFLALQISFRKPIVLM